MPPVAFCSNVLRELALQSANDAWVRGASALCAMYGTTDAGRFETILEQLASRTDGSALTQGTNWLLARWQSDQCAQPARP
jgi:hypothetical protein